MKKLVTLVCLLIATSAIANPSPGYIANGSMDWSRGVSGSTWQEWDFLTGSNPAVGSYYNPNGTPSVNLYEVPVLTSSKTAFAWHQNWDGRTGVWAGDAVYADVIIPNTQSTGGYKVVWMEVGFEAATIDQFPIVQPYVVGGGSADCQQLSLTISRIAGTYWNVMTMSWLIVPNPQSEMITFGFAGTGGYIDYITVDTLCVVPVPGAIILGGIGISLVGWMRRRKSVI